MAPGAQRGCPTLPGSLPYHRTARTNAGFNDLTTKTKKHEFSKHNTTRTNAVVGAASSFCIPGVPCEHFQHGSGSMRLVRLL
jgi:hypothetical protein